jgi:proline dehydrogenase
LNTLLTEKQKQQISFTNTEIAFKRMTNGDLKKAYWLFRMISNPTMVVIGKHLTNFALTLRLPIKGLIKKTIFGQFVGGETLNDVSKCIDQIKKDNIGSILDYSVEGKDDEESFDECLDELLETVKVSGEFDSVPFCVFKMTGIGSHRLLQKLNNKEDLEEDEQSAVDRINGRCDRLCKAAFEMDTPILVDAEESWIQDAIDDIVEEMMKRYNKVKPIVYQTIQMYRHDRYEYLKKVHQDAIDHNYILAVKVVRGAYMEKERDRAEEMNYPDPIQIDKESSDRDYNKALDYCIENIDKIALLAGTHNEDSNMYLLNLMEKNGIKKNDKRVYFAQLLGMSDCISFNLSEAGYNVGKYVPYGPIKELMPYLIRRAQENTSAAEQTGRELSLIMKELNRRKL